MKSLLDSFFSSINYHCLAQFQKFFELSSNYMHDKFDDKTRFLEIYQDVTKSVQIIAKNTKMSENVIIHHFYLFQFQEI